MREDNINDRKYNRLWNSNKSKRRGNTRKIHNNWKGQEEESKQNSYWLWVDDIDWIPRILSDWKWIYEKSKKKYIDFIRK